ncbi:DUF1146 family protein [Aliicoccus persicus]|uniref:Conserved hypothetical integral membrane protein n=1 Tax=Aliicoccus persicus TaxID=930138 RepID=A0A662Z5L0_9STAP|nr:DUF1146 family protein [Aliicoccus persicus]SEW08533.1 conserved hypothetical integral membrane protein [Aliicoccus persicus]
MLGFSELALMQLVLHIACVILAFWLLQSIRIEGIFRKGEIGKYRLLLILFAIVLGSLTSNYIMDFFRLVQEASLMFN